MAITTLLLSDTFDDIVTKVNQISSDLGDEAGLTTPETTDLVSAINEINTRLSAIDTNAEIAAVVETFFTGDKLDVSGIVADSANIDSANISLLSGSGITYDSGRFDMLYSEGGNVNADSAYINNIATDNLLGDSARFTTEISSPAIRPSSIIMDGLTQRHFKVLNIKDSTGSVILAGHLISTSNFQSTP